MTIIIRYFTNQWYSETQQSYNYDEISRSTSWMGEAMPSNDSIQGN